MKVYCLEDLAQMTNSFVTIKLRSPYYIHIISKITIQEAYQTGTIVRKEGEGAHQLLTKLSQKFPSLQYPNTSR
jgi:hypothetical protein